MSKRTITLTSAESSLLLRTLRSHQRLIRDIQRMTPGQFQKIDDETVATVQVIIDKIEQAQSDAAG